MTRTLQYIVAAILVVTQSGAQSAAARPNVVVVLCDDLGYGDLACYGSPTVQTPHIDRFAASGLRLTSCYAASANCSPARAGLLPPVGRPEDFTHAAPAECVPDLVAGLQVDDLQFVVQADTQVVQVRDRRADVTGGRLVTQAPGSLRRNRIQIRPGRLFA